jgi:amino-acid N-acetyltransferase
MSGIVCRKANREDVPALHRLIAHYADKGIMLPRSPETLERSIGEFVVAEEAGRLVGCGALSRLSDDLAEIRSLGVLESHKGMGVGKALVDLLVKEAGRLGISRVMALTYEVPFFEKNGFSIVPKAVFPQKTWRDCIHCKKRYSCDEIAVLKRLPEAGSRP